MLDKLQCVLVYAVGAVDSYVWKHQFPPEHAPIYMDVWIYEYMDVYNISGVKVYHGFKVSQGQQVFPRSHLWIYMHKMYGCMDVWMYGYCPITY